MIKPNTSFKLPVVLLLLKVPEGTCTFSWPVKGLSILGDRSEQVQYLRETMANAFSRGRIGKGLPAVKANALRLVKDSGTTVEFELLESESRSHEA